MTKNACRYIIIRMLKQSVTNYFKSLKYFFTPLGTMFLGIMLGLSIMFPGIVASSNTLIEGVKLLSQDVNLDFSVLLDSIWTSVKALDWKQPVESVNTLMSAEWINNTLTQSLNIILGTDFETFTMQIADLVNAFCQSVSNYITVFFVFWALGFIAGFALIRFLIRRNIAKRSLWKFILAYFCNSLFSAGMVVLGTFVYSLWKYSVIITITVSLLLCGIIALIQAYLLYGYKKIPYKSVVNIKNACSHTLANLIIFAISICFTLIAVTINKLMGIFVGLSFIAIAIIVINLNAESFVLQQVKDMPQTPNADTQNVDTEPELDEIK